jgi:Ca-activated chloride channel homolog
MKQLNLIIKAAILVLALSSTLLAQEPNPDVRPLDLGVVIDASGSMRRLMPSTVEAARLVVVNSQPKDEIFIERFISTDKIQRLQDFTSDDDVLARALGQIYVEGGQSAIIDAVYTAAHYVAEHNRKLDRRKALVLFTDGEDRQSTYNVEKLVSLLREEKVQVFIIGLTMDLDKQAASGRLSARDKAEKLLKDIAKESGGRVFFPRDKTELVESVNQIIHDLHGPDDSKTKKQ